ncbi:MAG TPA: EipA family protein [Sphingomonas sp.]|nr:EipA family protein [Sphingomonas sp.]
MRFLAIGLSIAAALASAGSAQVRTIDPNQAIDADLSREAPPPSTRAAPRRDPAPADLPPRNLEPLPPPVVAVSPEARAEATTEVADTYPREDLMAAGEGVFGKGAAGLGGILEKILKEQGRPNAYIAGREAAGAFVVGLRYGSGVMSHKVEGTQPVYWTGPSVGFDVGGDANKVFVLVYNLHDTEELFHRFPAAEGRLYFIGGFAATYLRRGNIVLIPIRLGVGYRAGVNVGYMKITHKAKWMPF